MLKDVCSKYVNYKTQSSLSIQRGLVSGHYTVTSLLRSKSTEAQIPYTKVGHNHGQRSLESYIVHGVSRAGHN